MVGGLLLGPLGAVVGGMSGVGQKKQSVGKNYFVINYHPAAAHDEVRAISLEIVGATLGLSKFISALKEKAHIVEEKSQYL